MPKCANVVILVILTNVLTVTLFSTFKYEQNPTSIPGNSASKIQPLPQPNQLTKSQVIQTGRVIQSVMEDDATVDRTIAQQQLLEQHPKAVDFEKRKKILDSYCDYKRKQPVPPFTNDPTHLFILQDRGVLWCPVFKAGSSTWLSTLVDLSSKTQVNKYLGGCLPSSIRSTELNIHSTELNLCHDGWIGQHI